jgi:hypothetical protein
MTDAINLSGVPTTGLAADLRAALEEVLHLAPRQPLTFADGETTDGFTVRGDHWRAQVLVRTAGGASVLLRFDGADEEALEMAVCLALAMATTVDGPAEATR